MACGIFLAQASNPCALHCQADSYPLHHQGSSMSIIIIIYEYCYIVYYCCCNKRLQNWWLKTAHICYLTVLEFKSLRSEGLDELKSRCQQDCFPSGGSRGESISLPFAPSGGCPHSSACGPSPIFRVSRVRSCSCSIALIFCGYIPLLPPSSAFKDYVVTLHPPG